MKHKTVVIITIIILSLSACNSKQYNDKIDISSENIQQIENESIEIGDSNENVDLGESLAKYNYSDFIGEWTCVFPNSSHGILLSIDSVKNNNEMNITTFGTSFYENLMIVDNQVQFKDISMSRHHNSESYWVELTFYEDRINAKVYSKERYLSDDIKKESELENYVDEYWLTFTSDLVGINEKNKPSGVVTFNGEIISSLFGCSLNEVINVMGTWFSQEIKNDGTPNRLIYNGIHFWFDDSYVVRIEVYNTSMLEIDGVSMDKNSNELISVLGEPSNEELGNGLFGTKNAYIITYNLANCSINFEFHEGKDELAAMINISKNMNENIEQSKNEGSIKGVDKDNWAIENGSISIVPNQSHIGTWYLDNVTLDHLIISEINADKIEFELLLIKTAYILGTAEIENNEIKFGENISSDYDGPPMSGTFEFNNGSITVTINESEFEYIQAGTVYSFTVKED